MKRHLIVLLSLVSGTASAQTDTELLTKAKLTLSYFDCAQLAPDKPGREDFINRGVKTGRAFLTAVERPEVWQRLQGQIPFPFWSLGPSIDFKLGQAFDNEAYTVMKDFDVSKRSVEEYTRERAVRFDSRNCSLLPK